ncbi:DUF3576 domain-containing protein [Falsiroseomonas selenitidurans]|uniref:DUF3576 domain-containing protein n=1 Tax=Falsiroseomonas selenitidurans TaxID=2716335 RepID=A0ABX1EF18_9PROT|nr:DUF3576 domain-containing protein [Falsiroseomonas selenitidurans]NKC34572.1 DUF3576 domain-containing protein [Falsiroseomonas selenitidurans]
MRRTQMMMMGVLGTLIAGCSSLDGNLRTPELDEYSSDRRRDQVRGRLGGQDGILVFGTDRSQQRGGADQGGTGIGVNAYLWRAALDTLSFMPLSSADPFGGVLITDWYSPPGNTGERFRATAYILGRQLRSDGVRVSLFRQELRGNAWVDVPVSASTASELEDQVLGRARELRAQSTAAAR